MHALIRKGDEYLVTRRSQSNDWKAGEWDTPGGSVEFGEVDPKEALAREILEETGLVVRIGDIIHLYTFLSDESRHQFQFVYECEYLGGEIRLNPEEHDEFQWIKPGEFDGLKMIAFLKSLYEEVLKPRGH